MDPQLPNEYNALLRHAVTGIGVALTSRGLVTAEDWQLYGGLIISIAPSVFAFIVARRNKRKLQQLSTVAIATTQVAVANELAKPTVPSEAIAKANIAEKVATVIQQNGHAVP